MRTGGLEPTTMLPHNDLSSFNRDTILAWTPRGLHTSGPKSATPGGHSPLTFQVLVLPSLS